MLLGIISITVGFLIVLSVQIYFIANIRGKLFAGILSCLAILYSVACYFSIDWISGWPTYDLLPQEAYVISYTIDEPVAMYFWLQSSGEKPRAYEIPYDRELHKRLTEGKKKAKRTGGRMLLKSIMKRGAMSRLKRGRGTDRDKVQFKITNPQNQLKKE